MDDDLDALASRSVAGAAMPATGARLPEHESDFEVFSAFVLTQPNVTQALLSWRRARGFAPEPIEARLLATVGRAPRDRDLSAELLMSHGEIVHERRVALYQGEIRLAEAVNRYVPSRLPSDLATALDTGSVPFGTLIAPLGGRRLNRGVRGGSFGQPLEHRAVVCLGDGTRVALVEERFLPAVLDRATAPR